MKTLFTIVIFVFSLALPVQAEWKSSIYPGMTESHPVPQELQRQPLTLAQKGEAERIFWELVDATPDPTFRRQLCDMIASGSVVLTFEDYAQNIGGFATTHTCLDSTMTKFIFDIARDFLVRPNLSREDKIVVIFHEFQHLKELWTGESTSMEYQWPSPPDRWIEDLWTFSKRNFFSELSAYCAECRLAHQAGWQVTQKVCQGYESDGVRGAALYLANTQYQRNSYGPNARFMEEWIEEFILTRATSEELAYDRRRIVEEQAQGIYATVTPAQYDEVVAKLRLLAVKHPRKEVGEILRALDNKVALLKCAQNVEGNNVRKQASGFSLFVTPDIDRYPIFWFGYPFMTDPRVSDEERMLSMWHEYQHLEELLADAPGVARWNPNVQMSEEAFVTLAFESELKATRAECSLAKEPGWSNARCLELAPLDMEFPVRFAERMASVPGYSNHSVLLAKLAAVHR